MPSIHFINISDREADVFDLFLESKNLRLDILVRAAWNRRVLHPEKYLWDHMEKVPICGHVTITVPRKKRQPHREAILSIRYDKISLKPPKHHCKEKGLKPVTVWAVWAHESDPPDGVEPISWMLLTTVPVHSFEEALEKVRHEYEELADRLMPVVYEQLGNGKWFEANAPFSIGCDVCRGTTLELCSNFLKKTEEYRGA